MEHVNKFRQSYSETPWRKQVRNIVSILLLVVSVAIIAYLYLNVTAQTAAIGREIQGMEIRYGRLPQIDADPEDEDNYVPIEEVEQRIAVLKSELANLTSYAVLGGRARALGLDPVNPAEITYLEVPGYRGKQPVVLAPPPIPVVVSAPGISPAFQVSLLDWIKKEIVSTSTLLKERRP